MRIYYKDKVKPTSVVLRGCSVALCVTEIKNLHRVAQSSTEFHREIRLIPYSFYEPVRNEHIQIK